MRLVELAIAIQQELSGISDRFEVKTLLESAYLALMIYDDRNKHLWEMSELLTLMLKDSE
ncbi:hypothetical protein [Nostoc sp.]|uniref:hypothetical protein n=1 Tax=Nostoc sp. TaxID=1180 RepID=UPI002FF8AB20